jgi:tRNA (guanine26-N2/guanine27-N2)-dimethyltransferase
LLIYRRHTVDLKLNDGWKKYERDSKAPNYQMNPLPNWGPAPRARNVKAENAEQQPKRKIETADESEAKRAKVVVDEEDAVNS